MNRDDGGDPYSYDGYSSSSEGEDGDEGELYSDDAAGWEQDWNAEDSYIAIPPPAAAPPAAGGGGGGQGMWGAAAASPAAAAAAAAGSSGRYNLRQRRSPS